MESRRQRSEEARRRLDQRYARLPLDALSARPRLGWVRAVRDALGMTTRQLAAHMGVAQATVVQLERSEANDTIQLSTLRRAADALGCDLVYALVPRAGSLDRAVHDRAMSKAVLQVRAVDRSMELEDQAVTDDEATQVAIDRATRQVASSRRLWDA